MEDLNKLRMARAAAVTELLALASAGGDVYEAKKKELDELGAKIGRIEEAQAVQARLATPVDRVKEPFAKRPAYASLKAFRGKDANEHAYRAGMFVLATVLGNEKATQWCRDNGVMVQRAASEGIDSAGGYLVPEEMEQAIIVLREAFGVFRRECLVVPMGRDTLNWPRRTAGLTAYFVAENTAPTESQSAWDNVNLTAKKMAVLTRFSTEISDDAIINLGDWLVGEIAYAFAAKEDDCGFNGDGTASTYGGMRGLTVLAVDGSHNAGKYTAAGGHNTFALLDGTDITGLMAILPAYALPNAKFFISQVGFAATFERLIAAAGGNSINTLNGEIVLRYLGFPIVIAQKLPILTSSLTTKAMFHFGDLRLAAALGDRRQIRIVRSEHRYMDTDQVGILGTERFDINVHDMGDNTTAGPLVSMVAP